MGYRIALIGAGNMGSWHANQWAKVSGAEIVGVLDTRPDAAGTIAPGYSDWSTLLRETKPDIIDICTPTPTHRHYAELAAAAGKAIFVEKPLARTLEDCDAIVKAVEKAGVPAMPGHVVRYFPEFASAKKLIDSGAIGKPVTIRTARMAGFPTIVDRENWYANPDKSGGVVLDMILHDFDWIRWTFGPVTRVNAVGLFGTSRFSAPLDYALVTLRFVSGAVGHVTGSWSHPSGFRTTFEVAGDKGLIEHDSAKSVPLVSSLRSTDAFSAGVAVPESPMRSIEDPYYKELSAFTRALETGSPVPISLSEAHEAARIALAALQSIATGLPVDLS